MLWLWKQAETIQFEYILKSLFQRYSDYADAVAGWTAGQWREHMAQKMAEKEYSEEARQAVWEDFGLFMEWCGQKRRKKQESEAAGIQGISWLSDDADTAEDLEREQRKIKSVPVVQRLLMRYEWARNALKVKESREKYCYLIEICQLIVENWDMFGCLEEFEGVMPKYEETVLEFFAYAQTLESLLQVMVFYCDKNVLDQLDKDTRKQYLKTGLEYAKLFWDNMDNEEGAYKYVCYYCRLAEEYGEGEEILERSIRNKIWKIGEECALGYQSKKILDALGMNINKLAEHFRCHGQEAEALKCEQELESLRSRLP